MFWPNWLSSSVQTVEETAALFVMLLHFIFQIYEILMKHFKIIFKKLYSNCFVVCTTHVMDPVHM